MSTTSPIAPTSRACFSCRPASGTSTRRNCSPGRACRVIADLSRRVGSGVVILDSPPLLATNEAQVATRYAGQVLLVVRADRTEQRAVLDALALVDKSTSGQRRAERGGGRRCSAGTTASITTAMAGTRPTAGMAGEWHDRRRGARKALRDSRACLVLALAVAWHRGLRSPRTCQPVDSSRSSSAAVSGQESMPHGAHLRAAHRGARSSTPTTSTWPSSGGDIGRRHRTGAGLLRGLQLGPVHRAPRLFADRARVGRQRLRRRVPSPDANGRWIAIPEWFCVSAQASYGDRVIDPSERPQLRRPGRLRLRATLPSRRRPRSAPCCSKRFKDFEFSAAVLVRARLVPGQGQGSDPADPSVSFAPGRSNDQNARRQPGPESRDDAQYFGRVFYDWQKSEFERSLPYRYERAGFDGGCELSRVRLSLRRRRRQGKRPRREHDGRAAWTATSGVPACVERRQRARRSKAATASASSAQLPRSRSRIAARYARFNASYSEEPAGRDAARRAWTTSSRANCPRGSIPSVDFGRSIRSLTSARTPGRACRPRAAHDAEPAAFPTRSAITSTSCRRTKHNTGVGLRRDARARLRISSVDFEPRTHDDRAIVSNRVIGVLCRRHTITTPTFTLARQPRPRAAA